jgi:hypothetical protein
VNPSVRASVGWRKRLAAAFTDHLAMKASALLVTLALWFLVGAREPTEEVVGVRFAPQLDSSLAVREPTPAIRALVMGRPSEILKLSNTPLVIRRQIASDSPDTLVMSLRTSDVEVPEGIEVIVRDVQPRSLALRFESTVSRMVRVRSTLFAHAAYPINGNVPLTVRLDPESVSVTGPRVDVARIQSIPTVADTIAVPDTLPHLIDLDTTGLGVTVRPPQVKAIVQLPVSTRPASPLPRPASRP